MEKKKIYFYATELINKETGKKSLVFSGQNGMRGHRAGGGESQINFVLNKLIELNGIKKGSLIYQKFNEALLEISKDSRSKNRAFPKACLVLMEKINDNKIGEVLGSMTETKKDIHSGESRLEENGESEKKTASTA